MMQFDSVEEFERKQVENDMQTEKTLIVETNDDYNLSELHRLVNVLDRTRKNDAHRMIVSHGRYLGDVIVFCKKVIRKCLKWYINPICEQQTEWNNAVTSAIENSTELFIKYNQAIADISSVIKKQQIEFNIYKQKTEKWLLEKDNMLAFVNQELEGIENEIYRINQLSIDFVEPEGENIWNKRTVSQTGEDAICFYILKVLGKNFKNCTYLDLGANHAKELSNTFFLYERGAKGVLVEANPALIPELKFFRHNDLILNKCVAPTSGDVVKFYVLNGDGLSTTNLESAKEALKINSSLEIINEVDVETITVNEIIEKYFGTAPTLLNIDIEGYEMEILKNIDFAKYRPLIIITEMIEYDTKLVVGQKNREIVEFMNTKDYVEYAFTGINSIFIDRQQVMEE